MPSPIVVLINSKSGVGEQSHTAESLQKLFAAEGADVEIAAFDGGADLVKHAEQAVAEGREVVVAAGGDGTVSGVASVVAGTRTALGVLPLGTLNHFAKDLGIPLTPAEAVSNVVAGNRKPVDVGEVNGRVFVNNSSVGMYPTIVQQREQQQRLGKRKWSAFARAVWTVLGRYPLIHCTIVVDGKRSTRTTPLLFVGNNPYEIHGLRLGSRKRLDCGTLAVYLTRDVGRWALVWFAVRALFGRLREARDFESLETTELSVRMRRRRTRVAADGEVTHLDTPLEYRIRPGALQVIVPADSERQPAPAVET